MNNSSPSNKPQLDLLNFHFQGIQLIEASAGTGKTYTLAALFVRLVLGHGFERPLLPQDILVLTFTKAATQELRDRIRSRLHTMAKLFAQAAVGKPPSGADPFERSLLSLDCYADADACNHAAWVLDRAAQCMDEASIYTIHGWCQRTLSQHALGTQQGFANTLLPSIKPMLLQAAQDYWRVHCTQLPAGMYTHLPILGQAPNHWLSWLEKALQPQVQAYFEGKALDQPQSPAQISTAFETQLALVKQAREQFLEEYGTLSVNFNGYWSAAYAQDLIHGNKLRRSTLQNSLLDLHQWVLDLQTPEGLAGSPVPERVVKAFSPHTLADKLRAGKTLEPHPLMHALQAVLNAESALQSHTQGWNAQIQAHVMQWVEACHHQRMQAQNILAYDDLIVRLHHALVESPSAPQLAQALAQQYPVAMVDEFQDTDALQYALFRSVYFQRQGCALLTVGDPKQSIYGFRGADLDTYFAACADAAGQQYSLPVNFRSSADLVAAVNHCFGTLDQVHAKHGVFFYSKAQGNPMPFVPVQAQQAHKLQAPAWNNAALQFTVMDCEDSLNVQEALALGAAECADAVVQWLQQGDQGQALLNNRPVTAGDMAILVRDFGQAYAMQQALRERGVRSVYLSEKDNVLTSTEALDVYGLCYAVLNPKDTMAVRGMLTAASWDFDVQWLHQVQQDEFAFEAIQNLLLQLRKAWQSQGVLAMVRQFLFHWGLPAHLLSVSTGERTLTNVLQVAEWLQTCANQFDGAQALMVHFEHTLQNPDLHPEETILRLESDDAVVRILTYHKSKGLEFPFVFLPFFNAHKPAKLKPPLLTKLQGQWRLELGEISPEQGSQHQMHAQQETMRLLYVALTRAKVHCHAFVLPCGHWREHPVHELLGGLDPNQNLAEQMTQQLLQLALAPQLQVAVRVPSAAPLLYTQRFAQGQRWASKQLREPACKQRWWIASYSALQLQASTQLDALDFESSRLDKALELLQPTQALAALPTEASIELAAHPVHQLPKGPALGNLIHALLEWSVQQGVTQVLANAELRLSVLKQKLARFYAPVDIAVMDHWWVSLLQQHLPLTGGHTVSLSGLNNPRAELEFLCGVHSANTRELDALITQAVWPGANRPALRDEQLHGMLKGFIDLVFEHQGKYWVCDYKSNWLGPTDAHYTPEAMQSAILDKRYDVQFCLYLVAMHRLLKARMPGYAEQAAQGFDQHVGGALYWFVRGVHEPQHHGALSVSPPASLVLQLDAMLQGHRQEVRA